MDTFQQTIHLLANTMLVFPVRNKTTGKQEHKNKEITFSLALFPVESVSIFVGTLVVGIFEWWERSFDALLFNQYVLLLVVLPILIFLLLCVFLIQWLHYRCCHTWAVLNRPHYTCCYPMCGSRLNILEEEVVELDETGEMADHDTLPMMRLHRSCGSCKDLVEEEIVTDHFGQGSIKSTELAKAKAATI